LVKKNAATHAKIFSNTKKMMIFHNPELKIGEGGGCITFEAVENTMRRVTK
jgi:hypothetical protein